MAIAERITITLPKIVADELGDFAEELGEKKSHIIADALERYFDYLDLRIVERRAEELRNIKEETVSFEDIKKELGI